MMKAMLFMTPFTWRTVLTVHDWSCHCIFRGPQDFCYYLLYQQRRGALTRVYLCSSCMSTISEGYNKHIDYLKKEFLKS